MSSRTNRGGGALRVWPLQDAKNRLSEVVNEASTEGPQVISRRGRNTAVILSFEDYARLTRKKTSLASFFRGSPLAASGLTLERSRDVGRKVDL